MSFLERADGRFALEDGLRQLAIVQADIAQDDLLQILAAAEAVALQAVFDPSIGLKAPLPLVKLVRW